MKKLNPFLLFLVFTVPSLVVSQEPTLDHRNMTEDEIKTEVQRILGAKCIRCHSRRPPPVHYNNLKGSPHFYYPSISGGRMPPKFPMDRGKPKFNETEDGIFLVNWLADLVCEKNPDSETCD